MPTTIGDCEYANLGRTKAAKRDFHKASQLAEQAGDSKLKDIAEAALELLK